MSGDSWGGPGRVGLGPLARGTGLLYHLVLTRQGPGSSPRIALGREGRGDGTEPERHPEPDQDRQGGERDPAADDEAWRLEGVDQVVPARPHRRAAHHAVGAVDRGVRAV